MLAVSDEARELILTQLESALEGRPELRRGGGVGLRLSFGGGKAQLSLAFPRPNDHVMRLMGRPLLIIDQLDLAKIDGACLIVKDGPKGRTLSLEPKSASYVPSSAEITPQS